MSPHLPTCLMHLHELLQLKRLHWLYWSGVTDSDAVR